MKAKVGLKILYQLAPYLKSKIEEDTCKCIVHIWKLSYSLVGLPVPDYANKIGPSVLLKKQLLVDQLN